jgi:hypothetical protein
MTKIANMTPTIPRGKIIGKITGGAPLTRSRTLLEMRSLRWLV